MGGNLQKGKSQENGTDKKKEKQPLLSVKDQDLIESAN